MNAPDLDEIAARLAGLVRDVDGHALRNWARVCEPAALASLLVDLAAIDGVGTRLAQMIAELEDDARRLEILAHVRGEREQLETKREQLVQRRRRLMN